jgi:hypothetical protein
MDLIEVAGMSFITYAEKFGLIPKTASIPPAKAEMIN